MFWKENKVNIILFLLTIVTTIWAGNRMFGYLFLGGVFSAYIMTIIGIHEFGHYIHSKRNNVDCSLPYFIPAPNLLGTFGAVIKMKSSIPNRNALMEIGAAGPLYGFIPAFVAVVLGMIFGSVSSVPASVGGLKLGYSILYFLLAKIIKGVGPAYIAMNPLLFAGWIGLFVTALNLLPMGQLDGGHVVYALFSKIRNYRQIAGIIFWAFVAWGIVAMLFFYTPMWLMFAAMIYFLGGRTYLHPPLDNELINLTPQNKLKGWVCLALFILTFLPAPFTF